MNPPERRRSIALVGAMAGERRATHTEGYPLNPELMLPLPDVLLLVVDDDPGAMLYRYTAHGELGGDTWHETVGEAIEQAFYEYAESLGSWIEVPDDVADAHGFAVQYAFERLNRRGDW